MRYDTASAAVDLAAAGVACRVLGARDGDLVPMAAAEATGGFAGAGLDSRRLKHGQLFVALAGERTDGRRFAARALAAGHWVLTHEAGDVAADLAGDVAPAPDTGLLVCADPLAALAALAAAWRVRRTVRVAAVTGTNGKTTTKDLLAALLSGAGTVRATCGNLNNHLGVPLTLLGLAPEHGYAVVEMGASAVGEIARLAALARPEVGIITNAAPAHLAEFGSLGGIIEGKGELAAAVPAEGTLVLNTESPGYGAWRGRTAGRVVSFGAGGDHPWAWRPVPAGGVLELDGDEWPVPLPGAHNGANLAVAVLAARALGVDDAASRRGLEGFSGSPHRGVSLVLGERRVLDDAYNANPRSVATAAAALLAWSGGRAVAVLGAMAELGPDSARLHEETGRELARLGLDHLVSVGEGAEPLGVGFAAAGGAAHHCADHDDAVAWLLAETEPGDRILIKGSRSAAMEEVVEGLAARLDAPD